MVTWLIDGNNLKCSRGVPDERSAMIAELEKIASPRTPNDTNAIAATTNSKTTPTLTAASSKKINMMANVVLVFDGDHDESFQKTVSNDSWFQVVVTDGRSREKDRADHYMIEMALPELAHLAKEFVAEGGQGRVHVVSADKELGKRAMTTRLMHGGSLVHPPKFWKQYLPNLQRIQRQQQHADYT